MSDHELLDNAARAMGFPNWDAHMNYVEVHPGCARGVGSYYWKPLHDDGDAFRLASKLGLTVYFGDFHVSVEFNGQLWEETAHPGSVLAAARRAIVRAAAARGEQG